MAAGGGISRLGVAGSEQAHHAAAHTHIIAANCPCLSHSSTSEPRFLLNAPATLAEI